MRSLTFLASLVLCAGLNAQVAIVNGASNRADQPLTQGSWATAYGTFAGVPQTVGTIPVATNLAGVTLSVDGVAAPLYYVSPTQINFLVPYALAPGLKPVQIKFGGNTIDTSIRVITAAPGIFEQGDGSAGPPKGAVLNQNSTLNTADLPALRADVIQIFATGPGALKTPVADGAAPPSSPLVETVSTPQVFIDGVSAKIFFSGLAPGFPGLWQVNAQIPDLPFIKGRVPVQIFMDGVDSNEVSIFVAQ